MEPEFPRLDFAPGWQATNENLMELVDLFAEEQLDWAPREGEWTARVIFAHIIGARYLAPIADARDLERVPGIWPRCRTRPGIQQELHASWEMLAGFLRDAARLDAPYDAGGRADNPTPPPPLLGSVERATAGMDLGYVDVPNAYTGHYIAYHRFAHDLHHRSTIIGYLSMLGVSLDGHRIRPL